MLNSQGLIHIAPGADSLTGVVTDPAAGAGKRVLLLEEGQGFPIFSLVHQGDETLDAYMGGTGSLAGSSAPLGYAIGAWNGLFILFEHRFSHVQALVVLACHLHGAHLGAFTTAGALGEIHIPWIFPDNSSEISLLPIQGEKFGIG